MSSLEDRKHRACDAQVWGEQVRGSRIISWFLACIAR